MRRLNRIIFTAAVAATTRAVQAASFTNPLAAGADPWALLYNGNYYYTDTTGGDVRVAGSTSLSTLPSAPSTQVYYDGNTSNYWAPEIHYGNDGHFYIYYSATVGTTDNAAHRMYVLQSTTSNPTGPYTFKGQLTDPTNLWAIDGTTLTMPSGQMYSIWSGWAGTSNVAQNLYIAPMSNPYTISGSRTLISAPTNSWETVGASPAVNEGPEVLVGPNGTTTVIYSASGSWTDSYQLGELKLTGTDPSQASSWTKVGSVFSSANGVYGPGHASFTTSDNGTRNWIVYHANVQSIASGGTVWNRNVREQPFSWNPDGTPSFGQPVPVAVPIQTGPVSWVGAINGTANDSVHDYLSTANWLNGQVNDSFADITLTDTTTLYLSTDHATAGDLSYTFGSGQKQLTLASNSPVNRTLTINGNLSVNILGGANSVRFGMAGNPLAVAVGATARTFNVASDDSVVFDGNLTGTAAVTVTGGGTVLFRGAGKTFAGTINITQGTVQGGDGTTASGTTNLPATNYVVLGMLALAGGTSASSETVTGISGTGVITGSGSTPVRLTVAGSNPSSFAGTITGANLSVTAAGPGLTFSGAGSFGGDTTITAGALTIAGRFNGSSNLFVKQGAVVIPAGGSLTTTNYTSIGQSAGDNGTATVAGTLVVPNDLNVADVNATGALTITAGAAVSAKTLSVGKYGAANGLVTQSGGSMSAIPGGGDWRIGGSGSSADAAAVGVYNLSGGSVDTGVSNFQIGAYGHGTVNQTGGTVAIGGYGSIGRFTGGVGLYNISGGALTATNQLALIVGEQGAGTLSVGGTGAVVVNGLTVDQSGGTGAVVQTGGTVTASAGVLLAKTGGSATYRLTGGTLSTANVAQGTGVGTFVFDGGTLKATTATTAFVAGLTTANVAGGARIDTAGYDVTIGQVLSHDPSINGYDGGLTKLGNGTLSVTPVSTYTGDTTVSGGTLLLAGNAGTSPVVRSVGTVTTAIGASLVVGNPTTPARTLLVARGFAGSGTVDLGHNDADVPGGNLSALSAMIAAGGIYSSTATADPSHLTTVGISSTVTGTVDGRPPSPGDVVMRYTYFGDANLDGKIDGSDYTLIDAGYGTGTTWSAGDFNYDGVIDGSDYTLIDDAFNLQGTNVTAAATALVATAAVPEPAGVGLVVVGMIGLRRRLRLR